MALHHAATDEQHLEQGIRKWMEMEDKTIAIADKIIDASDNTLVKTMAGLIKADSEKHKMILDTVMQTLEGAIALTPEDLGHISELLDEHMKIEKESIALGMNGYEDSKNFVVRHLLSYLIADEEKHYKLLGQLNDFKRHIYPYGIS